MHSERQKLIEGVFIVLYVLCISFHDHFKKLKHPFFEYFVLFVITFALYKGHILVQ